MRIDSFALSVSEVDARLLVSLREFTSFSPFTLSSRRRFLASSLESKPQGMEDN